MDQPNSDDGVSEKNIYKIYKIKLPDMVSKLPFCICMYILPSWEWNYSIQNRIE